MVESPVYNKIESGLRIKALRLACGFSQKDVADLINMDIRSIQSIELGRRGLSFESAGCFARLFHRSVDYIVYGPAGPDPILAILNEDSITPEQELNLLFEMIRSLEPRHYKALTASTRTTINNIKTTEFYASVCAEKTEILADPNDPRRQEILEAYHTLLLENLHNT